MKCAATSFVHLLVLALLSSILLPAHGSRAGLSVLSESYAWSQDKWVPGGGTVALDGWSLGQGHAGAYSFVAQAYAQARMYGSFWNLGGTGNHAAGCWRRYSWDVDIKVQGDPGSQADIYLDLLWAGTSWAEATAVYENGYALADCSYSLSLTDSDGSSIYYKSDTEQIYIQCQGSDLIHASKDHIDKQILIEDTLYIGRLSAGAMFSFTGYCESYANAYAPRTTTSVTTQAAMDACFVFDLTTEQVPQTPSPGDNIEQIPAPGAILLAGFGATIVGCFGRRRLL